MTSTVDLSGVAGMPVTLESGTADAALRRGDQARPARAARGSTISARCCRTPPRMDRSAVQHLHGLRCRCSPTAFARADSPTPPWWTARAASATSSCAVQGTHHSAAPGSDTPYLEIYEIWHGSGAIYLQDAAAPDLHETYLIDVGVGDKVLIPRAGSTSWSTAAPRHSRSGRSLNAIDATLIYDPCGPSARPRRGRCAPMAGSSPTPGTEIRPGRCGCRRRNTRGSA